MMKRRIRGFLALVPADRRLLLRAALAHVLLQLVLRVAGFARCHRMLERLVRRPARSPVPVGIQVHEAERITRLVQTAARHGPLPPTCLSGSLTLWWLLRRKGIEGDLRIGVRRAEDGLEAHAWVEHAGHVLNDRSDVGGRFLPLVSTGDIMESGAP